MGGGLHDSKAFEELFCLRLDIFTERGGRDYLIPKMLRHFFPALALAFQLNGGGLLKSEHFE